MRPLRALSLYIIAAIAAVLFAQSLALADATASPPTQAQNLAMLWPMIGLALANITAYLTRKVAPEYHFFHTAWGSAVLALLGAVITSVTPIFQSGSVTWVALAWAAVGGVSSWFSTLNPSTTTADPPVKSPAAKLGAQVLPLVFIALAISACAHLTPDEKAFGAAYGSCMEAKGLAAAPGVAGEVWNDLNTGTNQAAIVAQLEALGAKAGTDAVSCAVSSWLGSATTAARNPAGVDAAKQFLGKKTTTRRNRHAALSPPCGYGPQTGALGAA